MISVCIPVFNVDVRKLAETLLAQSQETGAEIILIDDASKEHFRAVNRKLRHRVTVYHELDQNIGRSRIRNLFLQYAKYEQLLFLDCDAVILSADFLSAYEKARQEHPEGIICGGRIYYPEPPGQSWQLHWHYGTYRESRPVDVRQKSPNRSFMTNNFLIPRKVLEAVPFNEDLTRYGHEDSLFGYELEKKGQGITHIDNPVMHGELQSNNEYVDKTRDAVRNLVYITELLDNDPGFIETISLLKAAEKLRRSGFMGLVRLLAYLYTPFAGALLRLGLTSLRLLDVYKLGLYLRLGR